MSEDAKIYVADQLRFTTAQFQRAAWACAFDVVENIVEVTLTQLVAAGARHEESPSWLR